MFSGASFSAAPFSSLGEVRVPVSNDYLPEWSVTTAVTPQDYAPVWSVTVGVTPQDYAPAWSVRQSVADDYTTTWTVKV